MENLTNMNRNQLADFVGTFEHNAFQWVGWAEETAQVIEHSLEREDTTNAVPTATPSSLNGRPLAEEEVEEVLYRAVHDLYTDIQARDTINEGGEASLTPIISGYYDENELTEMWVEDYRKANDYEHMSDDEQAAFDEKTGDFLEAHALFVVDLDSQLGALLRAFGWDESQTAFHAFAVRDAWENFLIVPENGANVEDILFSEPEEAAHFYEFATSKGLTVNIENRVDTYDVDVDVTRAFAETYANLNSIELSDDVLEILAAEAADNAEVFALLLDSVEGRALATLWGIPERPSFADNLALYQAHKVIAMDGNLYSMKPLSVKVA